MADFYADMAKMARELLAPTSRGGLGQGTITVVRTTQEEKPADWPEWEPWTGEITVRTYLLNGVVRGIEADLVDGTSILATDEILICSDYMAEGVGLSVSGTPVTDAVAGEPYAGFSVTASGGNPPYRYFVSDAGGSLPDGITIDQSTGAVSGTATTPGIYENIILEAEDLGYIPAQVGPSVPFDVTVADTVNVDGKPVAILREWPIPAAGTRAAYRFIIRR